MDGARDTDGVIFTVEEGGETFMRVYRRSDSKDGMIVIGRMSSATPGDNVVRRDDPVGGHIVTNGMAAFMCPVMSRQHARLVFGDEGQIYISDPPDHSHHGTYITRGEETFKVGHPQALQTGDKITFGKPVHRSGEIYEPLTVKVELLSPTTTSPANSFTGKGYALPPNIDNESAMDEEIDEMEPKSSFKHYLVEEILSDDDASSDEIKSSDLEDQVKPDLPLPPVLPPQPSVLSWARPCPPWAVPKPVTPSQVLIQSRQPTSPLVPPSLFNSFGLDTFLPPPWRLQLSNTSSAEGRADSPPHQLPPLLNPTPSLQIERERDKAVALSVLKERDEVIDVDELDLPPSVPLQSGQEVIDVDALPSPEPEVQVLPATYTPLFISPIASLQDQNVGLTVESHPPLSEEDDDDESSSDVSISDEEEDTGLDAEGDVDIVAIDDAPPSRAEARPQSYVVPPRTFWFEPPPPILPFEPVVDAFTMKPMVEVAPGPQHDTDALSDASDRDAEFKIINQSVKDLQEKVDMLEGSRNRSKRRFHLHKTEVEAKLKDLQEKHDTLLGDQHRDAAKELVMGQEIEERKKRFDETVGAEELSVREKTAIALRDMQEAQDVVAKRQDECVKEFRSFVDAAQAKTDARMDALNADIENTIALILEVQQVQKYRASAKRKREEEEASAVHTPAPCDKSIASTTTTDVQVQELSENSSNTEQPTDVDNTRRPVKRRRLARVAAPLLAGAAVVYISLGMF